MRAIDVNLKADFDDGIISRIVLITLKDGTKYGYTDHDFPLTVDSELYVPAPGLQTLKLTSTANAEVSTQELGSAWVDVPQEDLIGGKFDSATLETAWCSWKNPAYGKFVFYSGMLGEISWTEEGFKAEIASLMNNLAKNVGQVYTASCRHTLFGQSAGAGEVGFCGVDPAAYSVTGSVASVDTPKWKFTMSALGKPDGYFSNGTITFTSGTSNGLTYQVKAHTGNQVTLALPTAFVIATGTTFVLKAGCDKTLDTCKAKFNNVINFGGFPHVQTDVTFRS